LAYEIPVDGTLALDDIAHPLGKGNITFEVRGKRDSKIGSVSIGQRGVDVGGKAGRRKSLVKWDDLNR
jgi:hypothetical protein